MKPKAKTSQPAGFALWVHNTRALWKWLDLDELLFGFFLGSVMGFGTAAAWFTFHT